MEAFLVSTGIVALAEMGDKTQLLSLVLAARFRKPWPIVWGILVATLVNHGLAGAVGSWVTSVMGPDVLRWLLGASFIAKAFITVIGGGSAILAGTASASALFGLINQLATFITTPVFGEVALFIAAVVMLRMLPQGITGRFFKGSL